MTGNVGGTGGVNQSTGSAGGEVGGNGNPSVSLGDSAGNGGGGGGYVGGHGSHANGATDCSAGGGGGGGTSYALNGSGATYGTTRSGGAVSLAFYGFVGTAPAVTTQPTDTTVNDGQTATFSAAASGNPTPGVQWQVSADSGTTWTNILGANATTLSLPVTVADTGKQVRAVFANSIGTATTSAANLTVDIGPAVTTQPTDQLIITGQSVSFTAGATGNPAPTVQWQVSTDGGTTFADVDATAFPDVTGATSDTMTFTTADGQSGDIFQAVYTNSVSSATSSPATLTLETPPSVTTDPTSGSVIVSHGSVVFTAAGTGNPTPTIQWQVSTNGGTTWANVSGGTKASLTVAPYSLAQSGWQYHAVFTNAAGTATSAAATLTVLPIPPLVITTASLPDGVTFNKLTKKLYSATLAAQWGNQPYFWYVIAGSLPPGLKVNKGTGVISGKAAMMGTYTFTVKVLDAKGPAPLHLQNSATKTFSITIGS